MRGLRTIHHFAVGCMVLAWAGTALADATAEPGSPDPLQDQSDSRLVSVTNTEPTALVTTTEPTVVTTVEPTAVVTTVEPTALFTIDDCQVTDDCIDQYLWSLYERTPKVDAAKVTEKQKVTVKRKGKTRTVVKTIVRYVDEDFTWKDPNAAERAGLSLQAYVIGGMDPAFKRTLYPALRALDDGGLMPGITSAFRDDYRQALASGNKAAVDRSFHGGSSRGGYGHGLAVDLVSVKGATRAERYRSSRELWTWIDTRGAEFGIGRPYLHRDAPHVAPVDGKEYAKHRGRGTPEPAVTTAAKPQRLARSEPRRSGRASKVASSKPDTATKKTHRPAASSGAPNRQIHRTGAIVQPQKRSRRLSAASPTRGAL